MGDELAAFRACIKDSSSFIELSSCYHKHYENFKFKDVHRLNSKLHRLATKSDMTDEAIDEWMFLLNSYVRSSSKIKIVKQATQLLKKELNSQVKYFSDHPLTKPSEPHLRFRHLVNVASAASVFVDAIWNGNDDQKTWNIFKRLHALVLADTRVSHSEKVVLQVVNGLVHGFYPVTGLSQFVPFIEHGYSLPASNRELMVFSLYYKFYLNSGKRGSISEDEKKLPKGYNLVPSKDPRLKNRPLGKNCMAFALSMNTDDPMLHFYTLNNEYDIVDLEKKPASIGDLVAYHVIRAYFDKKNLFIPFPPHNIDPHDMRNCSRVFSIRHMAVVTEVGKDGFPKRVMSQFGIKGEIYEHPVDQVHLNHGMFWRVYRHK